MSSTKSSPLDLELITSLAKQFVDRNLFDEAAAFFQIAQRLDPDNLGIRLSLAQVRNQVREQKARRQDDVARSFREQSRRNAIDAFQFFGLGALYEERGQHEQANQCLEIAHGKGTVNPFVHKLQGRILLQQRRYKAAVDALARARRYNPFDRELAELASRAEYECEDYGAALDAAIDAFWLLRPDDREGSDRLKKRIRTLKVASGLDHETLLSRFHDRRERLHTAFERLEWHRERLLSDDHLDPEDAARATASTEATTEARAGRIDLAARLRKFEAFTALDDVEVFQLTEAVEPETLEAGVALFRHRDPGADIYLIEHGTVTIQRTTDYGTFPLTKVEAGAVLGELSFISHRPRSADAAASSACSLLRLDAGVLEGLIRAQPEIGLKLYQAFWRGLSHKLRQTNEQLRTFFFSQQQSRERSAAASHDRIDVDSDDKIQLLREQGLTGEELTTLATFSDVKRFASGAVLFHEGDPGEEMYVVLDGRVMISKFIPGGGEEALAILERGDFFGEMSLIDGQPRSADAKAHDGAATVIAFDEKTLTEVLSMDPAVALKFMQLLCRLICKRLREIDEKLTTWRIMAGGRDLEEAFETESAWGHPRS